MPRPADWITLREVARRLGIDPMSAYRVVDSAGIASRVLPGLKHRRYSAADVEVILSRPADRTSGRFRVKGA